MPRVEVFDRVQVLEKVKHLFWDKGFNGTSMQDLVDVTGLNRSSIYNSFGNKKALYELVLKQYQEEGKTLFKTALSQTENAFEGICLVFDNMIQAILQDVEGKGCFNMNCTTELSRVDISIRGFLTSRQEYTISIFKDLIDKGQQQGVINKEDSSNNYAYYLFSAFQGLRMTGMLTRDEEKLKKIVANTLKILN
ncbi:TetR/AcrR family transcriptional regulator [uncultured Dokdonia sp.]|uniref:TetR/AcrR family transcriptional regulator n=1 Tax=uncultured Dokdonia sp. TaxID=575653 RepID=UPI00262740DD|nr:TetR/AcrR family transcriptional regulator [uncultured Dokdonia sp.]